MRLPRLAFLAPLLALAAAAPLPRYAVTASIPGPDGAGWDYARVDPALHRLFVAHGDAVTAVDLTTGTATSFGRISRGHQVLPIPGTATLLVTSGNDNSVRLFDARTGQETARLAVGRKPDAAIWDAAIGRALVMNAAEGSIAVIDVAAARVDYTVAVKPGLEYPAVARDGTVFVNDEDLNEIEVVDLAARKAVGTIALTGCEEPSGLAYDGRSDRLVSACANGKAAVIDARARRLAGLAEIGRGPDAVVIDETRRVALVPCGRDGVLTVLALDGPAVRRVATVTTAAGARTAALDPGDGAVYLPTAAFDPPAAPGGRPVPRPGTFRIVVVRPS